VSAGTALAWLSGVACVYVVVVLALMVAGRGAEARALARFVPDCAVLAGRLLRDPRVARRHKLMLTLLAAYLASPIDVVPDFIPIAGQLDDAILVWLVLCAIRRSEGGAQLVREHWPGRRSAPV
jgi:uncharacterized membrane protein YkvA (DUF1232 family)